MSREHKVDLTPLKRVDLKSVTLRITNGEDTIDAAARVVPTDGTPMQPNIFSLQLRYQTVAQGIVAYETADGKVVRCVGPCVEWVKWGRRTMEYVGEVYDFYNGIENDERADFRKTLEVGPQPVS